MLLNQTNNSIVFKNYKIENKNSSLIQRKLNETINVQSQVTSSISLMKSKLLEYLNQLNKDEEQQQKISYDNIQQFHPVLKNQTTTSILKSSSISSQKLLDFNNSTLVKKNLSSISDYLNNISTTSQSIPCKCNITNLDLTKNILDNASKYSNLHDDYILSSLNFNNSQNNVNIWKMAFFLLAFLLSFLTIMFILTMITRIIISKVNQQRMKNKVIFNHGKKGRRGNSAAKLSASLALFDLDSGDTVCSTSSNIINRPYHISLSKTFSTNGDNNNLIIDSMNNNTNKLIVGKDVVNAIDSERPNKIIHKNLIISKSAKNDKNNTTTSNSSVATNSTSIAPIQADSTRGRQKVTSASSASDYNFELTNDSHNNNNNKDPKQGYIYGITNNAFLDDIQNSYLINNKEFVYETKNNNQTSNSFKANNFSNDVGSLKEKPTYQTAWKLIPNDYEALELNACALANITAFTTFSEVFDESSSNQNNTQSKQDLSLNNNELISRSAKITQELEIKLKERRRLLESICDASGSEQNTPSKSSKKVYDQIVYSSCVSSSRSSSSEDIQDKSSNNSYKNWPNELFNIKSNEKKIILTTSNPSCTCTCPCHTSSSCHSSPTSSPSSSSTDPCNHHIKLRSSKKAKIVIDGSTTLPTKRESIRMLIENKAVSENKKKDALELHLNTLLSTRLNNLNSNNNSNTNIS